MIYRKAKVNIERYEEQEIFTKDYLEKVGGSSQWTADNGVFFKEPESAPKVPSTKLMMPCFALFFRSKEQAYGKLPKEKEKNLSSPPSSSTVYQATTTTLTTRIIEGDKAYFGNFGFDTYCHRLYGSSETVVKSYTVNPEIYTSIDGEQLDEDTFKLSKRGDNLTATYYVSFINIMVGTTAALTVKLFASETEEMQESITVVNFKLVQLDDHSLPKRTTNNLEFENYSEGAIQIEGNNTLTVSKREITEGTVILKAQKELDKSIGLIAYYTNSQKREVLIGQSIITPNKPYTVKLKFLKVKILSTANKPKYTETHNVNVAAINTYLNMSTMCQAAIQVETPNTTIDNLSIKEDYTNYNKSKIADLLQMVDLTDKPEIKIVFNNKDSILAIKDDKSESTIASYVYENFKEYIKKKIENNALFTPLYDKYKDKCQSSNCDKDTFLETLLDIYHIIYIPVFLFEDFTCSIKQIGDDKWTWTEGFEIGSNKGHKKKIFISKFNMMQAEKNYSTYAHELGHALNLEHTFDSKSNGGLGLPAEGQTLENIMDYFKTPVDTDKNKLVDTDQPNCFIQQQWETMRTYCKARKSNEDEQFNFTVPNDIVDQFKKDCYALFDSL